MTVDLAQPGKQLARSTRWRRPARAARRRRRGLRAGAPRAAERSSARRCRRASREATHQRVGARVEEHAVDRHALGAQFFQPAAAAGAATSRRCARPPRSRRAAGTLVLRRRKSAAAPAAGCRRRTARRPPARAARPTFAEAGCRSRAPTSAQDRGIAGERSGSGPHGHVSAGAHPPIPPRRLRRQHLLRVRQAGAGDALAAEHARDLGRRAPRR